MTTTTTSVIGGKRLTTHVPASDDSHASSEQPEANGAGEYTDESTSVCVYCKTSSVTVRTGRTGNRFGLCADCLDAHNRTEEAIEEMEGFRTRMREIGQLTPAVENFVNELVLLASLTNNPKAAIEMVVRVLADKQPAGDKPRTWTFTNRRTGEPVTFSCMPGCTIDHERQLETPQAPEDVVCWIDSKHATLPINADGQPEELRVFSTVVKVEPFSTKLSLRKPYAAVEVIDDVWIEDLDADSLEAVINTVAERVDAMREMHARLVQLHGEYNPVADASATTA